MNESERRRSQRALRQGLRRRDVWSLKNDLSNVTGRIPYALCGFVLVGGHRMNTPTFIQAVPWEPRRAKCAAGLRKQTEGTVIWDEEHCPLETFLKVMRAMGDQPGIILEDDVILAEGWRESVEAVIEEHGHRVIRFGTWDLKDLIYGSRLIPGKCYASLLCTYFPAGAAESLLEYVGERRPKHYREYHDFMVGYWLEKTGQHFWNQVPALVQHRSGPSVVNPNRNPNRHSRTFGDLT